MRRVSVAPAGGGRVRAAGPGRKTEAKPEAEAGKATRKQSCAQRTGSILLSFLAPLSGRTACCQSARGIRFQHVAIFAAGDERRLVMCSGILRLDLRQ